MQSNLEDITLRVFGVLSSSLLLLPYRPKRCGSNDKDDDNSPETFNDKNHEASSQKF